MVAYDNNVCLVAEDTTILTPVGRKNVNELNKKDKLISTNNKVSDIVNIVYKQWADDDSAYVLNFSNGQRIVTRKEQRWKVKGDGKDVVLSTNKICEKYNNGESVFVPSPEHVDYSFSEDDVVRYISKTDKVAKRLLRKHEFSHAITLIAKAYCLVVNNTPLDIFPLAVSEELREVIERDYGVEVFSLVEDGKLPDWFFFMPLCSRTMVSGIIIDEIEDFSFDKTKRRVYATLSTNHFFIEDITSVLTGVGCTREVSANYYSDSVFSFCITESVKNMSLLLLKTFPDFTAFDGIYVVSLDSVEVINPKELGIEGFYKIVIKPKTRGVLLGSAPIMAMPY